VFGTRSQESCAPKLQILDGSATGRTACVHQSGELPAPLFFLLILALFHLTMDIKRSGLNIGFNKKAWIIMVLYL
jgi:hypothetical protein